MVDMTLLQWNIWYKEDIKNIIRFLKEIEADILCLQEVTVGDISGAQVHSAEHIAKDLGYQFFFQEAQRWGKRHFRYGLGNAIFSRCPMLSQNWFYLQKPRANPNGAQQEGRVYMEAELAVNDQKLSVGTTHIAFFHQSEDTPIKRRQFDKLTPAIKQKKEKYLLAGDLNLGPETQEIIELAGLLNHAGPNFSQKTCNTKLEGGDSLLWRLDYVFATPDLKILSAEILSTTCSDHLPILVEFSC